MKDFSIGAVAEIALALVLAGVLLGFITPMLKKNFEESFED